MVCTPNGAVPEIVIRFWAILPPTTPSAWALKSAFTWPTCEFRKSTEARSLCSGPATLPDTRNLSVRPMELPARSVISV